MTSEKSSTSPGDLDDYLRNAFLPKATESIPETPLCEQSHVASWREWIRSEVNSDRLVEWLPQLGFEIHEGVSRSPEYRIGILSGDLGSLPNVSAFSLRGTVQVTIEDHWAGNLPMISVTDRGDFEHLFQCLGNRGEPMSISPQAHALMVTGLISPRRIEAGRTLFEQGRFEGDSRVSGCSNWAEAMRALDAKDKCFFRDQFLLTHVDHYAGLDSDQVGHGQTSETWLETSQCIRVNHELTHHATQRLFGNMRLNLHDEIIADCIGFLSGLGCFDSDLFLQGLGIEPDAGPRAGGRVWMYVSGLDRAQTRATCDLAVSAARNLDAWLADRSRPDDPQLTRALACLSLPELASSDGFSRLHDVISL